MLLVDLLEAAKKYNWNVSFDIFTCKPVIRSDMTTLSLLGIYFSLVRRDRNSTHMKHNDITILKDQDMCDPIRTMELISNENSDDELILIVNFSYYIDQVISQHSTLYNLNDDIITYTKFNYMPCQLDFLSRSRNKKHSILLSDLQSSEINKMKLIADDFHLSSVTINMNTIIDDLKKCKWSFDVGDYNDE